MRHVLADPGAPGSTMLTKASARRGTDVTGVRPAIEHTRVTVAVTATVAPASGEILGDEPGDLVMVVDDDPSVRESLVALLATTGLRALGCARADEALALQCRHTPDVAVVDYRLPDASGIDLAVELKRRDPHLPVLLMTGHVSADSAVAAVGQLDAYLVKPVAPPLLLQAVRNAVARRRLAAENEQLVHRLERLNAYQALHDPLTGLPNRALLEDRLEQALRASRRTGHRVAVLFIDLDRFKMVNDLWGHQAGDQLLRLVAHRLVASRRSGDTVARFGGDEFVVVCPEVDDLASACRIAAQTEQCLRAPAVVEASEHRLTACIGVALSAPDHDDPQTLLRNADTAMYRAKETGGSWEVFDEAMREHLQERLSVEQGLRVAIERSGLTLAYQPLVALADGTVVGAEALVRWQRPGQGTVLPASFLPVAEEAGLMPAIGQWVLEHAVATLAEAEAAGTIPERFRMWVNASPQQLATTGFAESVADVLARHQVPAHRLGIEVLEQAVEDRKGAHEVLRRLQALGLAVYLDDFGAGHSNLARLHELPITGLKIDRQFVADLDRPDGRRGRAIVEGLLGLAHGLRLSIVAEGVESEGQAAALREMGCSVAQGFHFARPGTAADLWAKTTRSTRPRRPFPAPPRACGLSTAHKAPIPRAPEAMPSPRAPKPTPIPRRVESTPYPVRRY